MTNREESSAAEHETFPGPGPLKTDESKRGIRPVEQMVDAAIERIARETQARAAKAGAGAARPTATPGEPSHAITLARADAAALMAMDHDSAEAGTHSAQLARVTDKRSKGRLRWKGLEVSDEFRSYADRVARGEDLPPFTGKILAEPDPAFPWDPKAHQRAARRELKQQIGLWTGVALFLGLSVAVLVVQVRKHTDGWQAQESPLASVTMANQPGTEAAPQLTAAATQAENAPAVFSETVVAAEQAATAVPAEPTLLQNAAREEPLAAVAAPLGGGASSPASTVKAPAATGSVTARPATAPRPGAAVFVATRAPAAPTPSTPAGAAATASGAASEPLRAVGTGGTPAGASVSAGTDGSASGDPASALRADPKKEPTREASGMGSLLVESPSF